MNVFKLATRERNISCRRLTDHKCR